jgi:hypothetical protein
VATQEGTTNVVVLQEDNVKAVKAMIRFLYTGEYSLLSKEGDGTRQDMLE